MRRAAKIISIACAGALSHSAAAYAAVCNKSAAGAFSGRTVWQADAGVGFQSPELAVDSDGAPNSYRIDGKGLSYTCDGVTAVGSTPDTDPKHWQAKCNAAWLSARATGDYSKLRIFGFRTDAQNVPLVQKDGDPLPGAGYISATTVAVPDGPSTTQRHWVDATQIPYVVLPGSFLKKFAVAPGDVAVVYRPKTGKTAFAVYGDSGKLGEASVRLHQNLGSNPIVIQGGVARAKQGIGDSTITVLFPGQTTHPTVNAQKWRAEIEQAGTKALADWGGIARLKACAD